MDSEGGNLRARRFMGITSLASAAGLAFAAIVWQAPWWARAIVFVPLWFAGVGLLSPRSHRRVTITAAALTAALMLVR